MFPHGIMINVTSVINIPSALSTRCSEITLVAIVIRPGRVRCMTDIDMDEIKTSLRRAMNKMIMETVGM